MPCLCVNSTFAVGSNSGLSEDQLNKFAQNDILFYDPSSCVSGSKFSSICGSTPREKYWSALRQELDEVHAAAIFGSIDNEGSFGTTRWEIGVIVSGDGGHFIRSWDTLYNCTPGNCPGGVGAFGITWTLGPYLRQINSNNPDLLKYFKDPASYSYPGDETLNRIGDADYDRLVEQEVQYVINEADIENFKSTTNLDEATDWWTKNYENCVDCCGAADKDHSCEQIAIRRASAKKEYDEMKNFTCTAGSSNKSNGTVLSNSDIGQSIANKAIELAWGESDKSRSSSPTKAFSDTAKNVGLEDNDNRLRFVQTVVLSSGADAQFPKGKYSHNGGVDEYSTVEYMNDSGLWEKIDTTNVASLRPGDILVSAVNGEGDNRIFIYLGNGKAASANQGQWYGRIENLEDEWQNSEKPFYHGDNQYQVYRINPNQGCTSYEGNYPEYLQCDPRWGGLTYGNNTFCHNACGPTSMAAIVTIASGKDVFPTDIADLLGGKLYYETNKRVLDPIVCEKYGCETEDLGDSASVDTMRQYLQDGWMLHVSGGCPGGHSKTCPYSAEGHYIAVLGLKDNDTAIVMDSGWDGLTEYKLDDIANGMGVVMAIRGNSKVNNSCNDYCENLDTTTNDNLTDDQAKKIADYYNGPMVDASEYALPEGKKNCVSFSKWFSINFANLSWAGGNGKDVAHNLAIENNLTEDTEPRVFSVFSITGGDIVCEDGYTCGHTGVVVAVDGDNVTTIEAGYPNTPAFVGHHSIDYFKNVQYRNTFTYIGSSIDQSEINKIIRN